MRAWLVLAAGYFMIGWAAIFEREQVARFLLDSVAPALVKLSASFHQSGSALLCAAGLIVLGAIARARTVNRRALVRRRVETEHDYRLGR